MSRMGQQRRARWTCWLRPRRCARGCARVRASAEPPPPPTLGGTPTYFGLACVARHRLCSDGCFSGCDLVLVDVIDLMPQRPNASAPTAWTPLALGNCVDGAGVAMPNCFAAGVMQVRAHGASQAVTGECVRLFFPLSLLPQAACAGNATALAGAVAHDFQLSCTGASFCRVRTLAGASACPPSWGWEDGAGRSVVGGNGESLTMCYGRTAK